MTSELSVEVPETAAAVTNRAARAASQIPWPAARVLQVSGRSFCRTPVRLGCNGSPRRIFLCRRIDSSQRSAPTKDLRSRLNLYGPAIAFVRRNDGCDILEVSNGLPAPLARAAVRGGRHESENE